MSLVKAKTAARFLESHDCVQLQTNRRVQFIDLTGLVRERVLRSEITHGMVNVQTKHTTTGVVLNENEHRLLRDFEDRLEAWAPRGHAYLHNDLEARRHQWLAPDERPNGDAHARAVLLGANVTLNVVSGELVLGAWQRIFFVELDGPRPRSVSMLVMGSVF